MDRLTHEQIIMIENELVEKLRQIPMSHLYILEDSLERVFKEKEKIV